MSKGEVMELVCLEACELGCLDVGHGRRVRFELIPDAFWKTSGCFTLAGSRSVGGFERKLLHRRTG